MYIATVRAFNVVCHLPNPPIYITPNREGSSNSLGVTKDL